MPQSEVSNTNPIVPQAPEKPSGLKPKFSKRIVAVILLILFVSFLAFLLLNFNFLSQQHTQQTTNPVIANYNSEKEANALLIKLPSLYKDTKWEEIKKDTDNYIYGAYGDDQNVKGFSRVGAITLTLEQIMKIKQFENLYTSIANGWEKANTYNSFTYIKNVGNGKIVELKIRGLTGVEPPYADIPTKCPCSYTFKIFYSYPIDAVYNSPSPTPTPTIEPFNGQLPPIPDSFHTKNFVKTQIDVSSKFFDNFDFPQSIKNIPESELVGMECSSNISWDGKTFNLWNYSDPANFSSSIKPVQSNDAFYKAIRYKLFQIKATSNVDENLTFNYCKDENGNAYIEYNGTGFGSIDSLGNIKNIANIPLVFMSCGFPIELTTNGELIYACTGGDTRAHAEIYGVNMQSKIVKHYYSCVTGSPGIKPEPSQCTIPFN